MKPIINALTALLILLAACGGQTESNKGKGEGESHPACAACALSESHNYMCPTQNGMEAITLHIKRQTASGCEIENENYPVPGRIECNPLRVCFEDCAPATFDGGELELANGRICRPYP